MVNVCDAIMGNGKSQSAIAYMNEHPNQKFIYITPYLEEANRIKRGCPELHFVEPSNKIEDYNFKKHNHTAALIKEGRNIATTHQAFMGYTPDMLEDIRRWGYTLIVDENVDVLELYGVSKEDIQLLVDGGYLKKEGGEYLLTEKKYHGKQFHELIAMMQSRRLFSVSTPNQEYFFYWVLPTELFLSFNDVYILTYLFEGQSIHHFLKIYDIPYRYIGIEKTDGGTGFRFAEDLPGYIPEYISHLSDMIHIVEHRKMNSIGDPFYSLSMNWYDKTVNSDKIDKLKKNVFNLFHNIWGDVSADSKLWGTYKADKGKIKGKGYAKSFLRFNARATNEFRGRDHLAYLSNVFMNTNEQLFYQANGINIDNDMYALSIMVQWIWRSAIRDGKPIYIYIPSKRMRTLLKNWIDSMSKGGAVCDKQTV